jgi:hypothetical protein
VLDGAIDDASAKIASIPLLLEHPKELHGCFSSTKFGMNCLKCGSDKICISGNDVFCRSCH